MLDVHMKLNLGLPRQKQHKQTGLIFKEETTDVLHLEHSFVRSEIPGTF
jgi:hypothetical protein